VRVLARDKAAALLPWVGGREEGFSLGLGLVTSFFIREPKRIQVQFRLSTRNGVVSACLTSFVIFVSLSRGVDGSGRVGSSHIILLLFFIRFELKSIKFGSKNLNPYSIGRPDPIRVE
jgi:hypothetical protein